LREFPSKRPQRYYEFDQMVKCRDLAHGAKNYGAEERRIFGRSGFDFGL
jgi:hypothetical protein